MTTERVTGTVLVGVLEGPGVRIEKIDGKVFYARAWKGKAKKSYAHYSFKSEDERDAWADREVRLAAARAKTKEATLAAGKVEVGIWRAKIVVGDVFVNCWGYDQTNVDYYEVVRRSPTGATVWIRPIRDETVEGSEGPMCDHVTPVPGAYTGGAIKKSVVRTGLTMKHGAMSLHKEGEEHYRSWYA
jgi:hypothetical protein